MGLERSPVRGGLFVRLPRLSSFLQYTLLALTAVLVPPLAALVTATLAVEDLARSGSDTVLAAADTVDLSRKLVEHLNAMERLARQRRALGDDPKLAELYEDRRHSFVQDANRIAELELPETVHERLSELRRTEDTAYAAIHTRPVDSPDYQAAVEEFPELSSGAKAILSESTDAIAHAATRMQRDAEDLERRMVGQGLWVVPLVLLLMILAVRLIVRPLRSLDDAIRHLGSGELDTPIATRGPADVREIGARLEWLRQRLLDLESDRVRLFRHVSHELKTPLTCIREGTQLLADGVGGPMTIEQLEIAKIVVANASELHRRIEDLLRLSELRKQGTPLDLRSTALADVVRQVVEQNTVAARARSVKLDASLESVSVDGDAAKLRVAVDNLVTNAIKFSPAGGTVKIGLSDGPDGLRLSVEDEGPGFDPEERERVFEAFYQGQATFQGQVSGTGLGLAIAREYVRAHGGELHIEDGEVGARMVVRLSGQET